MALPPRLVLPLTALLAACAASGPAASRPAASQAPTAAPAAPAGPAAPATPGAPATPAQAEAQARAADLAFSAAAVAHDPRAFAAFLAPDAVFVSPDGVAAGAAAICNDWAPLLTPGGPTLAWTPDASLAAGSGDLVVTRGAWTLAPADGGPARAGRYLTVWRREPDGRLRVVLDGSDTPLPPESQRATRLPLRRVVSQDQQLGALAGLLLEGSREVGGFLLLETRHGAAWHVAVEAGSWRPAAP
jgi:ketosteroid isomerase-like protein